MYIVSYRVYLESKLQSTAVKAKKSFSKYAMNSSTKKIRLNLTKQLWSLEHCTALPKKQYAIAVLFKASALLIITIWSISFRLKQRKQNSETGTFTTLLYMQKIKS